MTSCLHNTLLVYSQLKQPCSCSHSKQVVSLVAIYTSTWTHLLGKGIVTNRCDLVPHNRPRVLDGGWVEAVMLYFWRAVCTAHFKQLNKTSLRPLVVGLVLHLFGWIFLCLPCWKFCTWNIYVSTYLLHDTCTCLPFHPWNMHGSSTMHDACMSLPPLCMKHAWFSLPCMKHMYLWPLIL